MLTEALLDAFYGDDGYDDKAHRNWYWGIVAGISDAYENRGVTSLVFPAMA